MEGPRLGLVLRLCHRQRKCTKVTPGSREKQGRQTGPFLCKKKSKTQKVGRSPFLGGRGPVLRESAHCPHWCRTHRRCACAVPPDDPLRSVPVRGWVPDSRAPSLVLPSPAPLHFSRVASGGQMPPERKPALPTACWWPWVAETSSQLVGRGAFLWQLTENKGRGLGVVLGGCFWGPEFRPCPQFR